MSEPRRRVTMGAMLPILALLFLGTLVFAFSRILLAVPEQMAPWVALLFAANILIGSALAASVRGRGSFAFLIGFLVVSIVGGGIAGAVVGERPVHSLVEEEQAGETAPPEEPPGEQPPPGEEPTAPGEEPPEGDVTLVAEDLTFDLSEVSLPAEREATVVMDSRDSVPHNVAIYTEEGGQSLFSGELFTGPGATTYEVPAIPSGSYYFQCDVHPTTMNGSVEVG